MKHETYKGRKLKTLKGKEYGYVQYFVNGVALGKHLGTEESALQSMRGTIDHVDTVEFARYGIEWYAPGTAAQCEECTASKAVDGPCLSQWCMGLLHVEALVMNEEFDAKAAPVCICPRMEPPAKYGHHVVCPLRATDTDSKENDDVSIKEGPLTERQVRIIEGLLAGKRHEEISRDLSTPDETISVNVVKRECMHITAKFKARTITQAVFIYSEAQAYRKAAREILKTRIPVPFDPSDEHANHVLEGLAKLYQGRHDAWMPS